jgi:hypothetical protein
LGSAVCVNSSFDVFYRAHTFEKFKRLKSSHGRRHFMGIRYFPSVPDFPIEYEEILQDSMGRTLVLVGAYPKRVLLAGANAHSPSGELIKTPAESFSGGQVNGDELRMEFVGIFFRQILRLSFLALGGFGVERFQLPRESSQYLAYPG